MNSFFDNKQSNKFNKNINSFPKTVYREFDNENRNNIQAEKESNKLRKFTPSNFNLQRIFVSGQLQRLKSDGIILEPKARNKTAFSFQNDLINVEYKWNPTNEINGYNQGRLGYSKPATAIQIKRRKEGLKKGQNQLILEKLLQKYSMLGNENIKLKTSTSRNFFFNKQNKINDNIDENNNKVKVSSSILRNPLNEENTEFNKQDKISPYKSRQRQKYNTSYNMKFKTASELNNDTIKKFQSELRCKNNNENIEVKNQEYINILTDASVDDESKLKKEFIALKESDEKKQEDELKNTMKFNKSILIEDENILNDDRNKLISKDKKSPNTSKFISVKECNLNTNSDNADPLILDELKFPNNFNIKTNFNKQYFSNEAKNNLNTSKENTFKVEEHKISDIVKRVLEKNKKEAKNLQKDYFANIQQNYMNLNQNMNKSQGRFFTASSNLYGRSESHTRPSNDQNGSKFNYLELVIKDSLLWKKHEEIWNNVLTPGYLLSVDLEKYLIPPNDHDIVISSYNKLNNNFVEKIILDDTLLNSGEEIQKWKKAYKRAVLRWHPDKLFSFVDELKLRDENKKTILKKRSSIIINNINKIFQNILEILKKINSNKFK